MQRLCCISGFYWSYVFLVVFLELVFLFQDGGCSCAGRAVAVFGAFRLDLSGMCRNIFCFVCPENLSSGFGAEQDFIPDELIIHSEFKNQGE